MTDPLLLSDHSHRDGLAISPAAAPSESSASALSVIAKIRELAADIKIAHSVFALPWAMLATVLAAQRVGGFKTGQLALVLICMVSGRTVAMVANRLLDAEFDAANPRTARRAIPSRRLTRPFMWVALVLSAAIFFTATVGFLLLYHNVWPVVLAVPVLVFLIGYSLMKRYTRFCHYYLGLALALAPMCAWLAVTGTISLAPLLMAGNVLFWTAGFDILYACQDFAFDVKHNLFSIPAKVGIANSLWIARATHLVCVAFLVALAMTTPELGILFGIGVGLAAVLLVVEHSMVKPTDLSKINLAFFTLNGTISLLLGGLGVAAILLHR